MNKSKMLTVGVIALSLFSLDVLAADFIDIIPNLLKSVVSISSKGRVENSSNDQSDSDYRPDGIKELFEFADNRRNTPLGSGFIIDATGYIITSYHVIEDTKEIIVTLCNGKELKARVVGYDEKMDIALLKVDSDTSLTPVEFGDSSAAQVGEWVLSIGNPYGFQLTVTKGIISCLARNMSERFKGIMGDELIDYIQTDAPINRGNSGSPLFNTQGKVIGMITAIFSETGFSSGLNFAIPSNILQKAIKHLRVFGKMRRGWIGISVEMLEPDVAESLGLAKIRGVTITKVTADSPGAKAGLQQGDIIVAIGDTSVNNETQLYKIITDSPIGRVVPIRVRRFDREITFSVMVGYRDDSVELGDAFLGQGYDGIKGKDIYSAGLSLADVSKELRKVFDLPDPLKGAVVINIMRASDAAEKDIRQGDTIVKVDQMPVDGVADFLAKLMQAARKKDKVALLIYRDGVYLYRAIALRKIPNNSPTEEIKSDKSNIIEISKRSVDKTAEIKAPISSANQKILQSDKIPSK